MAKHAINVSRTISQRIGSGASLDIQVDRLIFMGTGELTPNSSEAELKRDLLGIGRGLFDSNLRVLSIKTYPVKNLLITAGDTTQGHYKKVFERFCELLSEHYEVNVTNNV